MLTISFSVNMLNNHIELLAQINAGRDKAVLAGMGSAHTLSHVNKVLGSMDEDGYGDVRAVKSFKQEQRGR